MKRSHLTRDIVETAILVIFIFVVMRFVVQSYHVEGTSMEPSLRSSEYVAVNKIAYDFGHTPERGDVIIFHYPKNRSVDYIKRVVGLPGDTITVTDKTVMVNGTLLDEPYISAPSNPQGEKWVVPANSYFVLGDNRPVSDDSRYWGFVPKDDIVGKAVLVFWPTSQWQVIDTHPTVYAHIKTNHQ